MDRRLEVGRRGALHAEDGGTTHFCRLHTCYHLCHRTMRDPYQVRVFPEGLIDAGPLLLQCDVEDRRERPRDATRSRIFGTGSTTDALLIIRMHVGSRR